ncbi:hypothetical protein BC351_04300 [Paenibacillus ferrarius]|uniref:Uncharacterized protein n=1 Tax=Paenibacillus ferrarius TaxID=1469647 RepID=A0A1V4HKT1_9BACL|nr:hypothetical protein BC351_04300 [Paenibacillus ferrarius]
MQEFTSKRTEKARKPAIMQAFLAFSSFKHEMVHKRCIIAGIQCQRAKPARKRCIIAGISEMIN